MAIIERSEADIENETIALFNECKPLLDRGYSITHAIRTVKDIKADSNGFTNNAWYKRFREYAETQGYMTERRRP